MIKYLKISNLAVIDKVEVEFREGFNVLTGETGAGKSILVGALDLLLGAKGTQEVVRTGEEEAHVEGLFDVRRGVLLPDEIGCDPKGDELILARKVLRSGRSRCFINGNLATLSMLQSVGRSLVSIFGQHEHHVLLDPEEHIEILDRFGQLQELRQTVSDAFGSWKKAERDLSEAQNRVAELEKLQGENAAAVDELTEAALQTGEEEALVQERESLKKSVQIRERAFEAYQALYSRSGSLLAGFADVKRALAYLASADTRFTTLRDNLEDAVYRIEDVALELRNVTENYRSDPARLELIEERLACIRKLKKRYGTDVPGLLEHLEILSREAGDILDARAAVKGLNSRVHKSREDYLGAAKVLSEDRRKAARELEAAMKRELADLAMPHAVFSASFAELEQSKGSATGLEKMEFLLAANPGEDPRPLARVASGGEISRIMLALKTLQIDGRGTSTVIFDEVDSGIGGHTAFAVGTRLAKVAQRQQVLCVTHLHQIAALADHHLAVCKSVVGGRTRIHVTPLEGEKRVDEITRMLGAPPGSESVKEHVRRLMDQKLSEVSR